jgi:hypothetical protein
MFVGKRTSPARKMDTPQIFPSKRTPSYLAPCVSSARGSLGFYDACSGAYSRRLDHLGHNRQMVQAFLDKETDDTVGVKDEIPPRRVLVSDDRVERL